MSHVHHLPGFQPLVSCDWRLGSTFQVLRRVTDPIRIIISWKGSTFRLGFKLILGINYAASRWALFANVLGNDQPFESYK